MILFADGITHRIIHTCPPVIRYMNSKTNNEVILLLNILLTGISFRPVKAFALTNITSLC